MSTLYVYAFEDGTGTEFGSYTTQNYQDARTYAAENSLRVIAHEYEWSDSEVVDDFTDNPVAGFESEDEETTWDRPLAEHEAEYNARHGIA